MFKDLIDLGRELLAAYKKRTEILSALIHGGQISVPESMGVPQTEEAWPTTTLADVGADSDYDECMGQPDVPLEETELPPTPEPEPSEFKNDLERLRAKCKELDIPFRINAGAKLLEKKIADHLAAEVKEQYMDEGAKNPEPPEEAPAPAATEPQSGPEIAEADDELTRQYLMLYADAHGEDAAYDLMEAQTGFRGLSKVLELPNKGVLLGKIVHACKDKGIMI